jgi:hypothetical protein
MAIRLGLNAKLYRNTGTYGSPSWNEIGNVKDVTLNLESAEADVTVRANNGWRATVPTLKDASVEFEMVWDTADEDFQAIRDAYLNNATLEVLALDGPVSGAGSTGNQGLRAACTVTGFSRSEPLEEALSVSVTVKPAYSVNPPTWFVVP